MCHLEVAREKLNMPTNQPYGTQTAAAAAIRQEGCQGRAGRARLELDQNSKKFGSNHPSTFCSKLYIPSTINTWLRLWNTKLILRALAYFDPKLKKYTLGQKLTVMPLRLKSF